MAIGHDHITVTDDRKTAVGGGAAMNAYIFPDHVEIADDQPGFFSGEFNVLGWGAQGAELRNLAALTYLRIAVDDRADR